MTTKREAMKQARNTDKNTKLVGKRKRMNANDVVAALEAELVPTSTSNQFTRHDITRPHPVNACPAFIAIWHNNGNHTAIGCPTLEALTEVWMRLTGQELIVGRVMHVEIIQA